MPRQSPPQSMTRPPRLTKTIVIGMVFAAAWVLIATSHFGVGLSPDSLEYIAAAKSLAAGRGYLNADQTVFTAWPPLLPTALGALKIVGVDPTHGARYLNALCLALIVWQSACWFRSFSQSNVALLFGLGAVLVSRPLLRVSLLAWTEPMFCLFVLLFINQISGFLRTRANSKLLLAGLAAGAAMLTRYIGFTLIISGGILLLLDRRRSVRERILAAAAFGGLSVLTYAPWAIRNLYRSLSPTGAKRVLGQGAPSLAQNLSTMGDFMTRWFFPPNIPLAIRLPLGIVVLALVVAVTLRSRGKSDEAHDDEPLAISSFLSGIIFLIVYFTTLIALACSIHFDPIQDRLLSPIYVPLIGVFVFAINQVDTALASQSSARKSVARLLASSVAALALLYPLAFAGVMTKEALTVSTGGYSSAAWLSSDLIAYLRAHPVSGSLTSNSDDAVRYFTALPAFPSASRVKSESDREAMGAWSKAHLVGMQTYLAWFKPPLTAAESDYYQPEEYSQAFEVSVVHASADGTLFLLTPREGHSHE